MSEDTLDLRASVQSDYLRGYREALDKIAAAIDADPYRRVSAEKRAWQLREMELLVALGKMAERAEQAEAAIAALRAES